MRRTVLVLAAAMVAFALVASFELGFLPAGQGRTSSTPCMNCGFKEPVVDLIMPAIGSSGNSSNPDRSINMSLGASKSFEVDLYPTLAVNFSMDFAVLVSPGGGSSTAYSPSATFQPQTLEVGANAKGATTMTISVPNSAEGGTYYVVVSALNVDNSSQVWGLYFQLQVS